MIENKLVAILYDGNLYDLLRPALIDYTNIILFLSPKYDKKPDVIDDYALLILKSPVVHLTTRKRSRLVSNLIVAYDEEILTEAGGKRRALSELEVADIFTDNPVEATGVLHFKSLKRGRFNVEKGIRFAANPPTDEWICKTKEDVDLNHFIYTKVPQRRNEVYDDGDGDYEEDRHGDYDVDRDGEYGEDRDGERDAVDDELSTRATSSGSGSYTVGDNASDHRNE